jgi:hypothetical protein
MCNSIHRIQVFSFIVNTFEIKSVYLGDIITASKKQGYLPLFSACSVIRLLVSSKS